MEARTGGQVVVDSLVANGVEVVFGIPGTHSLPIYRHLASSAISHVTPRHEQGAGYAADGYARSSGRPGVCLVTTGPGVTNIATALGQAYSDSIPILVVSPGMPFPIEGGDRGYLHEMKDQAGATSRIVAWSHRTASQQDLADALCEAFGFFERGRPRPVHIEVPLEVLESRGPLEDIVRGASGKPAPLPEELDAAAAALAGGSRRALVLGGGARGAAAAATRLAEVLSMTVVTTTNGKGVVSERHPLSLGVSVMTKAARDHVASCDVVLAVGTELGDSDLWGGTVTCAGTFVRIDIDPSQLQKNARADLTVQGDADLALRGLLERIPAVEADERRVTETKAVRRRIADELASELEPWRELHESLGDVLAEDAIVAGDAAMACYFGTVFLLPMEGPSRWLYPTGFCTLGYGLPAAIGAKLANPGRQVMAIMGDGGVMFTLSELATAAQLGLDIPLVVVVNGGYGEIRREMEAMGAAPLGTDLPVPDFVKVAKGLGCDGVRTTAAGAGKAVAAAFGKGVPTLIEVGRPD